MGHLIVYFAGKLQQKTVLGGMSVPETEEVVAFLGGELFQCDICGILLLVGNDIGAKVVVYVVLVAAAVTQRAVGGG